MDDLEDGVGTSAGRAACRCRSVLSPLPRRPSGPCRRLGGTRRRGVQTTESRRGRQLLLAQPRVEAGSGGRPHEPRRGLRGQTRLRRRRAVASTGGRRLGLSSSMPIATWVTRSAIRANLPRPCRHTSKRGCSAPTTSMSSAAWGACLRRRTGRPRPSSPWSKAVRLAPRAVNLHQRLGIALAKAKRFDEAEAAFRRALALDPTDASSSQRPGDRPGRSQAIRRGRGFVPRGDPARPSISSRPTRTSATFIRDQDRYDEALACYATAIELRPDWTDVHNNVGVALGRIGRHEDAIRAYDRALALDPKHADARKNRAMMKLLLGDYRRGIRRIRVALEV